MSGSIPAVRVRDLELSFGESPIFTGLGLDIAAGEFVALLGKSGSGKTTLLRVLAGLERRASGTLDVPAASAVVFQEPRLLPWKRVWENVALGLRDGARERAHAALAEVDLLQRANAWPLTLSGGEAQRAGRARARVRAPRGLLLDEPFASIDALTRLKMHELVLALWQSHRPSVLLVTHDVDEALVLADRAVVIDGGRITAQIPIDAPRPRDPSSPSYAVRRRELLARLGVLVPSPTDSPPAFAWSAA
jgi:sulfonate transport system ATP-binding protein